MGALWQDLRFGLRRLAKNPGFTAVVIITLALGIGANTAVFSAFDQVILRLLPVENPRELVLLEIDGPHAPGMSSSDNDHTVYSFPQLNDFIERSEVFSGVIARTRAPVAFAHEGEGERVTGELVSGNFFEVLGVRPLLGRLCSEEDDRLEGGHPVVVISHEFWVRRLGGRDDVISQKVTLNGQPMTIIGVTPPEFHGVMSSQAPDVYVTLAMRRQMIPRYFQFPQIPDRMIRYLNLMARLKPGITLEQAGAAMKPVFKGILEDELIQLGTIINDQDEFRSRTLQLTPALQGINTLREQLEEPLTSVMALVGIVLLVACVNVAGLLMTKALSRSREIAVRIALGAGRAVIIRQVMVESAMLAVASGVAGLLVAYWTMDLLNMLVGADSSLAAELNPRVMAFNFVLAVVTGLLFGLAPALQAARAEVASPLKDQTAGGGAARRHTLFRRSAVVVQVALSMLLLVAAGLFVRSLNNLKSLDPGFRTDQLLTISVDPSLSNYDAERGRAFYDELLRRLQRIPGVRSAGASFLPVLGHAGMGSSLSVEGYKASEGEDLETSRNIVSTDFFRTLGIPLVMGREFGEQDRAGSPKTAVVNEAFVKRYFADRNPLGRRLSFGGGLQGDDLDIEIVGVVGNQKSASLREETRMLVYIPYGHSENLPALTFYLLSDRDEASLGPAVRQAVRELDANLPIYGIDTVAAIRARAMDLESTVAILASSFAGLATVLAAIGLYGLMAYGVARRTREFGIRLALGAQRRRLLRMVVSEAIIYLAIGLAIGIPAAQGLSQLLESQLFGLSARDPFVVIGAAILLVISVILAVLIPARRAAGINPVTALRYE